MRMLNLINAQRLRTQAADRMIRASIARQCGDHEAQSVNETAARLLEEHADELEAQAVAEEQ